MVIPPGKKLMFQSIPTWPTVDAKGRILETLTLARRLLVAEKCPSVPRWKNPNPKIWKKKTLMSPAWNAWGKLLIAYKATEAQSKGKRTKKTYKKNQTENLLWQLSSHTILLKSTESSKCDTTKSWLRKSKLHLHLRTRQTAWHLPLPSLHCTWEGNNLCIPELRT